MPEWPDDVLAGIDRPRTLPDSLRARLADALLGAPGDAADAPRPLGDALSARLADELADPLAALLAGVDGPRPLREEAHRALAGALARPQRRRVPVLGAAAAALVVLGGAGFGVAFSLGTGSSAGPSRASGTLGATHGGRSTASTSTGPRAGVFGPAAPSPGGAQPEKTGQSASAAPSELIQPSAGGPAVAQSGPTVTGLSPAQGPQAGGTWVTISGNGLGGTTAVHFGTTNAVDFVVVSATELRAETPPHAAGTVDVVVSGLAGSSPASPADRYTYTG